jgi:hypothetical protein
MSPKDLLHRWMDEIWNKGNIQELEPAPDSPDGPKKFEAFHKGMCSAISDIQVPKL